MELSSGSIIDENYYLDNILGKWDCYGLVDYVLIRRYGRMVTCLLEIVFFNATVVLKGVCLRKER